MTEAFLSYQRAGQMGVVLITVDIESWAHGRNRNVDTVNVYTGNINMTPVLQ